MLEMEQFIPLWSVTPFISLMIAIAILPYLASNLWKKFELAFLALPAFAVTVILFFLLPADQALKELTNAVLIDYVPFVILICSFYIISKGIILDLRIKPTPAKNSVYLLVSSIMASLIGTTSASMIFLPPFLAMNRQREIKTHSIIFFIFLVANVGGCLTPMGDPPLLLGFLKGVTFSWMIQNLTVPVISTLLLLLLVYFCLDSVIAKRDRLLEQIKVDQTKGEKEFVFEIKNAFNSDLIINSILLFTVIGLIVSKPWINDLGGWKQCFDVFENPITYTQVITNMLVVVITVLAFVLGRTKTKEKEFSWGPVKEVSTLFLAIFITMIPIHIILNEGKNGALSSIFSAVGDAKYPAFTYFWITGAFSAFLDNVPSYVLFFEMAGGDAGILMNDKPLILKAISMSSVFMGALTYIGNAPNILVKRMAEDQGIKMPSFLSYMLIAFTIIIPIFLFITSIFLT